MSKSEIIISTFNLCLEKNSFYLFEINPYRLGIYVVEDASTCTSRFYF